MTTEIIIQLCCYVIRSIRSTEESLPAAHSPREIWWTVSRNYTVLFLSRDVRNAKFNQYLPVDLTSLNVSHSRFRKPVMFWRWRRHGVAWWRHGRGAWHNCLLLATSAAELMLLTTWLGCGKRVIRKILNARSRASYGPYHGLELPNHGIKYEVIWKTNDVIQSLTHSRIRNHQWKLDITKTRCMSSPSMLTLLCDTCQKWIFQ